MVSGLLFRVQGLGFGSPSWAGWEFEEQSSGSGLDPKPKTLNPKLRLGFRV